jgi:hypothetical protein
MSSVCAELEGQDILSTEIIYPVDGACQGVKKRSRAVRPCFSVMFILD